MVSLFLVLDIFIDMIYIAIIGLELYFYITFDEDYIDIYFFFYIAEGVVISKILVMLFYIIGLMITKSTYINIGKLYCFIISIVNVIIFTLICPRTPFVSKDCMIKFFISSILSYKRRLFIYKYIN